MSIIRVNIMCWINKIVSSNNFSLNRELKIFRANFIVYLIELIAVEKHESVKEDVVF